MELPKITNKENFELHYLVNKILNPEKDKQSYRAALFSQDDVLDKNDVKEALGVIYEGLRVSYRSPSHLKKLLTKDLPNIHTIEDAISYINKETGKNPRRKTIEKWPNLQIGLLDYCEQHRNR